MTMKNARVSSEREKSDNEKETNCRRRIKGLLELIGYRCPTTDPVTLRAEAERKLNEINERNRIREIKKRNSMTTSKLYCVNIKLTEAPSISYNRRPQCSKVNDHENTKQSPELSPEVKSYIKKVSGSKMVKFVFKKKLTASDVSNSQGRLLMPLKQVERQDILIQMGSCEVVRVYVPLREEHYDLCLTQWDMNGNQNFVLKSGWNQVVKEIELQKSMEVQLWSFEVGNTPCLLLVPVDGDNVEGGCACKKIGDDDRIYGVSRSGGVIIREPTLVETLSTSEDEKSLRSRKGKEKVHEFYKLKRL